MATSLGEQNTTKSEKADSVEKGGKSRVCARTWWGGEVWYARNVRRDDRQGAILRGSFRAMPARRSYRTKRRRGPLSSTISKM